MKPRSMHFENKADEGTIRPGMASAVFTVVGGIGMAVLGVVIAASRDRAALLLTVVGVAIAGFMAPSLTSVHAVHWNADAIEGPSNRFGPTLGAKRATIPWHAIVKTGATLTGYWFVESYDKRRVYWSYLYKGHGKLAAALRDRCPGLRLPF